MDNTEHDDKIRQLRIDMKKAPSTIANRIGVTKEFVHFRLRKLGLPFLKMGRCTSMEGLKLAYLNGMMLRDMEREFGIGESAIIHWARRWGLPRRQGRVPSDEILTMEYVDNQLTCAEIGRMYGCADCSVWEHLAELGISRNLTEARKVRRQRILRETGLPYMIDAQGYPRVPASSESETYGRANSGMIRLHDLEMGKHLGRPIQKGENIHHINFDKMDNRIENLYLCESISEHRSVHHSLEMAGAALFKKGLIEFNGKRYVINKKQVEEYRASIEPGEIPDPIPKPGIWK